MSTETIASSQLQTYYLDLEDVDFETSSELVVGYLKIDISDQEYIVPIVVEEANKRMEENVFTAWRRIGKANTHEEMIKALDSLKEKTQISRKSSLVMTSLDQFKQIFPKLASHEEDHYRRTSNEELETEIALRIISKKDPRTLEEGGEFIWQPRASVCFTDTAYEKLQRISKKQGPQAVKDILISLFDEEDLSSGDRRILEFLQGSF